MLSADGFADNKSNGFCLGLADALRRLPATMIAAKQRVRHSAHEAAQWQDIFLIAEIPGCGSTGTCNGRTHTKQGALTSVYLKSEAGLVCRIIEVFINGTLVSSALMRELFAACHPVRYFWHLFHQQSVTMQRCRSS